jgi:hypothetical protein
LNGAKSAETAAATIAVMSATTSAAIVGDSRRCEPGRRPFLGAPRTGPLQGDEKLLDLDDRSGTRVHEASTWSFYFEGGAPLRGRH